MSQAALNFHTVLRCSSPRCSSDSPKNMIKDGCTVISVIPLIKIYFFLKTKGMRLPENFYIYAKFVLYNGFQESFRYLRFAYLRTSEKQSKL